MNMWQILGLSGPTSDSREIRRAYARALKQVNPEDDAVGFQALRSAYESALLRAEHLRWQAEDPLTDHEDSEYESDDDRHDSDAHDVQLSTADAGQPREPVPPAVLQSATEPSAAVQAEELSSEHAAVLALKAELEELGNDQGEQATARLKGWLTVRMGLSANDSAAWLAHQRVWLSTRAQGWTSAQLIALVAVFAWDNPQHPLAAEFPDALQFFARWHRSEQLAIHHQQSVQLLLVQAQALRQQTAEWDLLALREALHQSYQAAQTGLAEVVADAPDHDAAQLAQQSVRAGFQVCLLRALANGEDFNPALTTVALEYFEWRDIDHPIRNSHHSAVEHLCQRLRNAERGLLSAQWQRHQEHAQQLVAELWSGPKFDPAHPPTPLQQILRQSENQSLDFRALFERSLLTTIDESATLRFDVMHAADAEFAWTSDVNALLDEFGSAREKLQDAQSSAELLHAIKVNPPESGILSQQYVAEQMLLGKPNAVLAWLVSLVPAYLQYVDFTLERFECFHPLIIEQHIAQQRLALWRSYVQRGSVGSVFCVLMGLAAVLFSAAVHTHTHAYSIPFFDRFHAYFPNQGVQFGLLLWCNSGLAIGVIAAATYAKAGFLRATTGAVAAWQQTQQKNPLITKVIAFGLWGTTFGLSLALIPVSAAAVPVIQASVAFSIAIAALWYLGEFVGWWAIGIGLIFACFNAATHDDVAALAGNTVAHLPTALLLSHAAFMGVTRLTKDPETTKDGKNLLGIGVLVLLVLMLFSVMSVAAAQNLAEWLA